MLKLLLIIVFALLAALMFYVATRPATFRIQRSLRIAAPREKLFAYVADLHNFDAWSPWAPLDPAMRKTHSGAPSGVGAGYEWRGNNKVGHGRMEIVEAVAPERVLIKLDFLKPFEAHNMAEYLLVEAGGETEFTWAMYGPNNFLSKAMGLFFNMDRMVGAQFEQGLVALKTVAERGDA
ncbi:MAG: SRPBCC family protein [Rhodocyclales bacterium]|nr:SRPBCC family protein [Rhodocyclales bacterium]